MSVLNQKEYLKKYLKIGKSHGTKKKRKKSENTLGKRLKIIDDDIDVSLSEEIKEDLAGANEDAPQIVSIIDERPVSLNNELWKPIVKAEQHLDAPAGFSPGSFSNITLSRQSRKDPNRSSVRNSKLVPKRQFSPTVISPTRIKSEYSPKRRRKSDSEDRSPKQSRNHESEDQSPKRTGNSDEDQSPKRGRNRESEDRSPKRSRNSFEDQSPERSRNSDGDQSPKRSRNRELEDQSPKRSRNRESEDQSPKRRRNTDEDQSPKRSRNRESEDQSPKRRRNSDEDQSPKRSRNRESEDQSPNRRRNNDSDNQSPRRRKNSEVGHLPKQRRNSDSRDQSPRRQRNGDQSPKRRKIADVDRLPIRRKDIGRKGHSPERKRAYDKRDMSPKRTKDEEDGYSRKKHAQNEKSRTDSGRQISSRWGEDSPQSSSASIRKAEKTLSGKKSGLQRAKDLIQELNSLKDRENELFGKMTAEVSGVNAATISRKKKTTTPEEDAEQQRKQRELEAKYSRWGKGLKQVEDRDEKVADQLHEMSKPLARYADDEDLERYQKEQLLDGDPMLMYMRKKKKKQAVEAGIPDKPVYMGDFMPNRYGIPPGYRWDGVDRSNGYEQKLFQAKNSEKASLEEALMWNTEDM